MLSETLKNWIDVIVIGIMVCCIVVAVQFYLNVTYRPCVSNPLSFGARQLEDKYGYPFIGTGSFIRQGDSPRIIFDSQGTRFENINNINIDDWLKD